MAKILRLTAREVLDSRGDPTVEAELVLEGGFFGRASVPSGASVGKHEAVEIRDGGHRYGGKGVLGAVENVKKTIALSVVGNEFSQAEFDRALIELDGTEDKSRLGTNAILAASLAFAKASAQSEASALYAYFASISKLGTEKKILPVPMMNILNGGKHARGSTDIQECMIVPAGAPSFKEALRYGAEVFHTLKGILENRGLNTALGDEGGYAPQLAGNEAALELILEAVEKSGYRPGKDIYLAIDAAASQFFENGKYNLYKEGEALDAQGMIDLYAGWADKYPLISIEDGLAEDDFDGFAALTMKLGKRIQIVGDDLFATNFRRLQKGIEAHAANAILIKLNQIGTVSETIDVVKGAYKSGFKCIVSHRSGETEDFYISDFAVGLGTGLIKTGSLSRGERTAKYNRLLRIEEGLGETAYFPGIKAFSR